MLRTIIRFGLLLVAACSTTQTTTALSTPADGQPRTAGPGDTVMSFQSTRPMPGSALDAARAR